MIVGASMTFSCRNVLQCKPFGSAHLVSLWPTIAMVFQKIKINIFLIYPYSIFHILHFMFYSIYTLYSTITLYIPHFTPQFHTSTLNFKFYNLHTLCIPHSKIQIFDSRFPTLYSTFYILHIFIPHFILNLCSTCFRHYILYLAAAQNVRFRSIPRYHMRSIPHDPYPWSIPL